MTTSPDPLGKRALFWAPAERDELGPRHAAERDVPGKHALFSDEARAGAVAPGAPGRTTAGRPPRARVTSGAASRATAPLGGGASARTAGGRAVPGSGRPVLGPIAVDCSTCGERSEIKVAEFVVLHLPVWLWRPGRGYTRFMTCPACRRRTWVSASWAAWTR